MKMIPKLFTLYFLLNIVHCDKSCYFNAKYINHLYGSKTPYKTVRADIRDYVDPMNCRVTNLWSLHRHGNRNPGDKVTHGIKKIVALKDEIVASYDQGNSKLCAQDIEDLEKWQWDESIDTTISFLTDIGYVELYKLGKRISEKYPHLLNFIDPSLLKSEYYFRPTNEERTMSSAVAFIQGLTHDTNITLTPDEPKAADDVIRPYELCERYKKEAKNGETLKNALEDYYNTDEYGDLVYSVQEKLGIETAVSDEDIFSFYELCRFDRSWSVKSKSPWCSVFTNEDIGLLEYRDDLRHYYKNGYGSWVNKYLGKMPMKDLYKNFQAAVNGEGRKITSYFTHDTMLEMVFTALGLYEPSIPLSACKRRKDRAWRTSYLAPTANNIIALLYICELPDRQEHKVQILHNERVSPICPASGCTWEEFQKKFQPFMEANLEFCSLNYTAPDLTNPVPAACNSNSLLNNGVVFINTLLILSVLVVTIVR